MASTYSTNLALELIGTGDQAGTWGNTTNTNLGTLIEQAISGYVTQAVTTGNTTTITIPDGASGVARNMYIELTGTGGTNTVLAVPANRKLYFIYNNTTGAVTVKVTGQTGVSVAATEKKILVSNGTDIVEATSYITALNSSLTLTTLNVTSANITTLTSTSANITTLTGTTISATNMGAQATTQFQAASANITTVTGTTISATNMGAQASTQFQGASANITTATGTTFSATTMGAQSTTTFLGTSANITTVTGTTGTFTTSLDGAGNLRNIPQVTKTAAYTLATTDLGRYISTQSGTITVPNNTFAAGNAVSVYNDSANTISLTISTTTGYIVGTNTNRTGMALATRGICTVLFINPSYCIVSGNVT